MQPGCGEVGQVIERLGTAALAAFGKTARGKRLLTGEASALTAFLDRLKRLAFGMLTSMVHARRTGALAANDWSGARIRRELARWDQRGLIAPPADVHDLTVDDAELESAAGGLMDFALQASASDIGAQHERLMGMRCEIVTGESSPTLRLVDARGRSARRSGGVFYTPPALVDHLLEQTLEPLLRNAMNRGDTAEVEASLLRLRVCDPACGCGGFLIAAARRIAVRLANVRGTDGDVRGASRAMSDVACKCIFGVDRDALSIDLCRTLIWLEAGDDRMDPRRIAGNLRCGNALLGKWPTVGSDLGSDDNGTEGTEVPHEADAAQAFHWAREWPEVFKRERGGFDVVVGNPPFLNQLERQTVATRDAAEILRERSGGVVRGYADVAAAFLLLATRITREGGMIALVQPQSVLASRDARAIRQAVLARASLRSLWVANEHLFDASTFACAPVLWRGVEASVVNLERYTSALFRPLPPVELDMAGLREEPTWAHLVATASGVPEFEHHSVGTLKDVASATADFRDQYYGLAGFLIAHADLPPEHRGDREAFPPLVTTGLIDLARNDWADRPTRMLKESWLSPRIDRRRMDREGELGAWMTARMTPKILLATQTRVMEVWVDERGEYVPSIPLISVCPHARDRIWHVAAALASPVCTAVALRRWGGTALNADAIKLSARQAMALPRPRDSRAWDRAAECLRCASECPTHSVRSMEYLQAMADAMMDAYQVDSAQKALVLKWWFARLHSRSRKGSLQAVR